MEAINYHVSLTEILGEIQEFFNDADIVDIMILHDSLLGTEDYDADDFDLQDDDETREQMIFELDNLFSWDVTFGELTNVIDAMQIINDASYVGVSLQSNGLFLFEFCYYD